MALLSNPETRKKLISVFIKWKGIISFMGYMAGLSWLLILVHGDFSGKTYFSENALLPGLVQTQYRHYNNAEMYYREVQNICNKSRQIQRAWIRNAFQSMGFDVFVQNFTLENQGISGQNIHGILRAPRASGVESIILGVPWKSNCQCGGSLALMLSMAQHFRPQTYWAKNIIFLVTEDSVYGIKAWLEGYHGERFSELHRSELLGRAGKIQAALIIDIPYNVVSGLDVVLEGVNGMQPNLDLVNLVFAICGAERIRVKLHAQPALYGSGYIDQFEDYIRRLKTLVRMIFYQASGFPTGNHGMFFKYRIEAISLRGYGFSPSKPGEYHHESSFGDMGRLVEGIFRSFNNLLEHFHQSFFMYLLPANNSYISIGLYMPALGGILSGMLLYSISLWIEMFGMDVQNNDSGRKLNIEPKDTEDKEKTMTENDRLSSSDIWSVSKILILPHVAGILLHLLLPYFVRRRIHKNGQIIASLIVTSISIPLTLRYILLKRTKINWRILKLATLVYLTAFLVTISMLNFSLGFLLALHFVPVSLLVKSSCGRFRRCVQVMVTSACCPPLLLILLSVLYLTLVQDLSFESSMDMLITGTKMSESLIRYSIYNDVLGVWTLPLITLVLFPIWIILGTICLL